MAQMLAKLSFLRQTDMYKLYIKKLINPPDIKIREEVIITRAKIGYSHLTKAYLIINIPAPVCDTSNETISIEHILVVVYYRW